MEFYDKVDEQYLNIIKHPIYLWRVKLELLDHYENTIRCIEQDIDYTNAGSITCNNVQGTRKSCSITLLNTDLKYIPTEDSPFWFNRKFRLYLGLVDNRNYNKDDSDVHWTNDTDIYWFSKGVYITSDIHIDSTTHTVSISGIDKFAQLDGNLNVLQADEMNTIFEYGAKIKDVIRDILTLNMGNGMVLDPIDPIIDDYGLNSIYLYKEFTLSAGQYYGDFLNELATSYGADVFYDNIGRLVFRRSFCDDYPYWIGFRAPTIDVKYDRPGYQNPQETVKLTGVNKIIVATDNVETPNGSYTAINTNPRSPLCYNKIGARTLPENGGVVIINAGNITDGDDSSIQGASADLVVKRCRDYAEYRLMQETCLATSISFSCPPYIHLNEGDVILITDPDFALDCDLYIINSITFPLGADSIQLEVSNLGFLNTDISSQTQFSSLPNSPIKFGIVYIVGEVTGTPPANQLIEIDTNFTAANDIDETTHTLQFEKENHELINWIDNISNNSYIPGADYLVPHQCFTMTANWASYEDYILELQLDDSGFIGTDYTFSPITDQSSDVYPTMFLFVDDKKYYFRGRDYTPVSTVTALVDHAQAIKYCCVPALENTAMILNNEINSLLSNQVITHQTVIGVKYPNAAENLSLDTGGLTFLETMVLPGKARTITLTSPTPINLREMDFNNTNDLSIDISNSDSLLVGTSLETVSADNNVVIITGNNNSYILHPYGNSSSVSTSKIPNINFAKGIKIDNSNSQGNCYFMCYEQQVSNTSDTTINIGNKESADRYKGGLELYNVTAFTGANWGNRIHIILQNVYLEYSTVDMDSVKQLIINGDVSVSNNSQFVVNTQFNNQALYFNGDYLYVSESDFVKFTNLIMISIYSDVAVEDSGNFIVNNSSCTNIHFYGSVTINDGASHNFLNFICDNSDLSDVYFHDDNFTINNPTYVRLFDNNKSNFKIHGIANGNVQAFAAANNIPFEVITE